MTRKHFQLLADELASSRPPMTPNGDKDAGRIYQWHRCCIAVADACREANPRFDRNRFFAACSPRAQVAKDLPDYGKTVNEVPADTPVDTTDYEVEEPCILENNALYSDA